MIKPQHFAALAAVTALSVMTAVGLYAATYRWSAGTVEGTLLLPDLSRQAADLATIEIRQADQKLTLARAADGTTWSIAERDGYPAAPERVRALVQALARTTLVEPKTANREKHKVLELDEPGAPKTKGRAVRLLDTKGKPIGDVLVGKARHDTFGPGRGSVFVRRPGEAQSWLAMGSPKPSVDLKDWITITVFETELAKIKSVAIEHAGSPPLVVDREAGKEVKFKLATLPEGMKLKKDAGLDQIAQGVASIELDDVRRLVKPTPADKVVTIKLAAEGGLAVTFQVVPAGEDGWLSLSATGEGDAKKAADALNARTVGWQFKIPKWKVQQLTRRAADVLEKS